MIQPSTKIISRGNPDVAALFGKTHLMLKAFRGTTDNIFERREVHNLKITDAGRNYLIGGFKTSTNAPSNFNYHDFGTGTNAESTGDTALQTAVSESRITGTQDTTGGTYTSVATMTFSSSYAITEHGLFSQSAKGGTLLDRTVFAAINVVSGDSIQGTFTLTMASGG